MAGIYIEGMKMPKLGELLVIEIHPNGKVSYNLDLKSREIAKAIPAADVVEVRHGRWEQVGSIIPMYECDQCHAFALGGNFCPNCGSKMDGGQDK